MIVRNMQKKIATEKTLARKTVGNTLGKKEEMERDSRAAKNRSHDDSEKHAEKKSRPKNRYDKDSEKHARKEGRNEKKFTCRKKILGKKTTEIGRGTIYRGT